MNLRYEIRERIKEYAEDTFIEIDGRKTTFIDFERKSNKIAGHLNLLECQRPVMIIGHKNEEMLMIFYACFTLGIAYAPIDISTPTERVKKIYKEMNPSIVFICERDLRYGFDEEISLEIISKIINGKERSITQKDISPGDTAYLMFTSGTTGVPKGILISYEGLFNFIEWIDNVLEGKRFSIINQSLFSFDISIFDFYYSLFRACKIICITSQEYHKIADYMQNEKDVLLFSTPAYLKKIICENEVKKWKTQSIKAFLVGGDYFEIDLAIQLRRLFREASVYNLYGPTEATVVISDVKIIDKFLKGKEELPIGYVGKQLTVVDEVGNEVEEGEIGEIIIKGKQLAIGYLGDEKQTNEKFRVNSKGERYYLTGDLGECKKGEIFFRGRKDMQCKINGYRIEVLDVEKNIRSISGIRDVLCVIKRNKYTVFLEAYIILEENDKEDEQDIRMELKQKIPAYMIPKTINIVESFPLTTNGKVDRRLSK